MVAWLEVSAALRIIYVPSKTACQQNGATDGIDCFGPALVCNSNRNTINQRASLNISHIQSVTPRGPGKRTLPRVHAEIKDAYVHAHKRTKAHTAIHTRLRQSQGQGACRQTRDVLACKAQSDVHTACMCVCVEGGVKGIVQCALMQYGGQSCCTHPLTSMEDTHIHACVCVYVCVSVRV